MKVLVLDSSYLPLGSIGWQRAVALIWLEKAEVLESYDEVIRSVSFEMNIPAVIKLKVYNKRYIPRISLCRKNIYLRDKGKCRYCGELIPYEKSTLDHVIPKHKGGPNSWENLVIACAQCNVNKGGKILSQDTIKGMQLTRPNFEYLIKMSIKLFGSIPEQWNHYL